MMINLLKKIKIDFLEFLSIIEWTKSRIVTKLSIIFGFSLNNTETLIHAENPFKSKFEIVDKYSELEHYSYSDFESKNLIGHTFQESYHLKISDVILDTKTGILFTFDRKLISESSSWSPEYLSATTYTKPPRLNQGAKILANRPIISLSSNSFYHWLNEDLPHYLYLREKLSNPLTIVSMERFRFVSDFLISNSIDYLEVPRYAKCSEYNFISNKSNVGWPHPKDISVLRRHFSVNFSEVFSGKKVFISRINDSRSPLFEKELIQLLETNGWTILDAGKLTLAQQICEISSAEVLAGIHGAGLSGVNWMSPGTRLVEIGTDRFVRCFQRLAILSNVNYSRINYKNDALGLNRTINELENLGVL
jgi:hypothetical protein